ncbi:MAG: hypothetical protein ABIH11_01640 [Candidatus Altiarchaeota archaeon]
MLSTPARSIIVATLLLAAAGCLSEERGEATTTSLMKGVNAAAGSTMTNKPFVPYEPYALSRNGTTTTTMGGYSYYGSGDLGDIVYPTLDVDAPENTVRGDSDTGAGGYGGFTGSETEGDGYTGGGGTKTPSAGGGVGGKPDIGWCETLGGKSVCGVWEYCPGSTIKISDDGGTCCDTACKRGEIRYEYNCEKKCMQVYGTTGFCNVYWNKRPCPGQEPAGGVLFPETCVYARPNKVDVPIPCCCENKLPVF